MICNRCGAELPENSLFCFRCGNRLEQAPSQPQEQKSSSPFGTKTISDKHYSLEDIARQQREYSNEISFDLSSDRPRRKKKRRPPSQGSQLPSSGTSDRMDPHALAGFSVQQHDEPVSQDTAAEPSYQQQIVHSDQAAPAEQPQMPVQDNSSPDYPQENSTSEQAVPAQKTQAPVSQQTKAAFRYTITSPPVPLGLQRQVRLHLFGGNISAQVDELRRTYIEKKHNR